MKNLIRAQYIGKTGNGYENGLHYELDIDLFPKQGLLGRIFNSVDLVVKGDDDFGLHKDCAYTEASFMENWVLKGFV